MTAPVIDAIEIGHYLELLFPDPPADAWLVVSWPDGSRQLLSRWFRSPETDQAVQFLARQAQRTNMYVGLGLRHPDCTADEHSRGTSEKVYAIGGLWIEFDHSKGVHTSLHLPTPDELLTFIKALPFTFSLLIDSSGGYHGYLLFKELWLLDTPDDHQAAALLLRRFQRTIQARAADRGWKVDTTADLARVLRPGGTLNHKSGTPQAVTILHEEAVRYNPSDLVDAPWMATIEDTYTSPTPRGDFAPTPLAPMVDGCAWLRHCRDDAVTLPEPEWYSMLGIVGRAVEGDTIAHEWSVPYPRYSKEETTRKLTHALADAGPATCSAIRYDRDGEEYCRACQYWGKIKSPIVLGMRRQRTRSRQTTADGLNSSKIRESSEVNQSENSAPLQEKTEPLGSKFVNSLNSSSVWPEMSPLAYYGLAGEIIKAIAPHSESDPVALLGQLLTYAGVVMGRSAYYMVEKTRHTTNLALCLAGPTSKGRKGTAYDYIDYLFQTVDPQWTLDNIISGCGSGEGIIAAVRDSVTKQEPIRERGRVIGYQDVITDPGVTDKRRLIHESEFASVLKIAAREGNILSVIIRQLWETGHLRQTVKNNPLKATGAHIGMIGHITMEELRRNLTTTEAANGFGNRFLWLCVKRAQTLPEGGALDTVNFQPFINRLREVVSFAQTAGVMTRDETARKVWKAVYPSLSESKLGLSGALIARGEAQVLRLSMLYALLDQTTTIGIQHLNAALALWEYVEASVAYIFGMTSGDGNTDAVLEALQNAYPDGISRTDISTEVFHHNVRADEIARVLRYLQQQGRIAITQASPEGRGKRPKEIVTYTPTTYEFNELTNLSPGGYLSISNDAVKTMPLDSQTPRNFDEFNPESVSESPGQAREEFDV